MRKIIVFPGQKCVSTEGEVVTIAVINDGGVWAYGRDGLPKAVDIVGDAFGGEHDQAMGLAA